MKKLRHELLLKIFIFFFLLICFGCASYRPQSFWEVSKLKVDFEDNNFKVKRLGIQATAESPYIFDVSDILGIVVNVLGGCPRITLLF